MLRISSSTEVINSLNETEVSYLTILDALTPNIYCIQIHALNANPMPAFRRESRLWTGLAYERRDVGGHS
jgi:hypothetical protein